MKCLPLVLAITISTLAMACESSRAGAADPPTKSWQLVNAFPKLEFKQPVDLQSPRDGTGRLFVVEQPGAIRVFDNRPDASEAKVFLDIRDRVRAGGEMGLLGLAFPGDFKASKRFYVYYTADRPRRTVVSRFKADGDAADPASEEVLLTVPQPYGNHNGGQIQFGPDGMLYIALGDGGAGGDPHNHGQNRRTLLGTIVRIDVSGAGAYKVPSDNPFVGNSAGWRPEIWAWGLRNPWRFSFDAKTGELWAADVGQGALEEVDIIVKGGNYGWRRTEGSRCYDPKFSCRSGAKIVESVWEYGRSQGVSITGGYVYRGSRLPALEGAYLFADYGSQRVWALRREGKSSKVELLTRGGALPSSFGVDEKGEVYLVSHGGSVMRLAPR